jgi:O-acetyl-ADP-ribose deacetylase (regulator of RNase III)
VDGAIHRAAGPRLLAECRQLHGCQTGAAKITRGYELPAKYVIHTVGPVWRGGSHGEAALLAKAYANSLALAASHRLSSIAFPSISTGAYGYPLDQAARIALATVIKHLRGETPIAIVRFVLFNRMTFEAYQAALNDLCADAGDMSSA